MSCYEITVKDDNGNCQTYTASSVDIDVNFQYTNFTDYCGRSSKVCTDQEATLEAKLCPKLCETLQPCNPPKKPGLLKRIVRKIL